ncbi:MAG: RluA family pseudouridine synthase [Cyanobacteria bacterium P01_E01_bin.42]
MDFQVTKNKERLDRWLAEQLPEITRSRLQKSIEGGQVSLNGEICTRKKTLVHCGDRVSLHLSAPEPASNLEPEAIPLDILYEDTTIIIINKASGMVVHPAPGHDRGTLVHALLYHCQDLAGIGGVERPGIVHRLDKDTTGAIVVAKTDFALQHLQQQIQTKIARREYLGIVCGVPKTAAGTIDAPIGRHLRDRKKMGVVPLERGGRSARTHWQILERLGNYTLMQFRLETGRTHQIRVHSAHYGHPLVGDITYSSKRKLSVNLSGQALHARRLCLQHPLSGEPIEAIAPLPADFTKLLNILRKRN